MLKRCVANISIVRVESEINVKMKEEKGGRDTNPKKMTIQDLNVPEGDTRFADKLLCQGPGKIIGTLGVALPNKGILRHTVLV